YTEVVGSAFIPASVALCTYWNRRISLWLLGGLALVTFFMYPRNPTGPLELPLLGALYLVCFQAGLVLALYREKNFLRARFCLLAFPVFMFERLLAPAPHLSILLLTAGAALLLYGVTRGTLEKFLSHSPLRLLGKISYSLYLFHCPVLYLVGIVAASLGLANLKGLSPALSIFMTAIPAAFLVAWGTYKSIEAPSIACGRKISEWLMCRKGEAA
ncbi:MAG: acyltransferase family protein, partial [Bdellovibrionales bacterium]